MSRAQAKVGDLVADGTGQHAIVTDIRKNAIWVLRPPSSGGTSQWETDDPDSLHVLESRTVRASRLRREQGNR